MLTNTQYKILYELVDEKIHSLERFRKELQLGHARGYNCLNYDPDAANINPFNAILTSTQNQIELFQILKNDLYDLIHE